MSPWGRRYLELVEIELNGALSYPYHMATEMRDPCLRLWLYTILEMSR